MKRFTSRLPRIALAAAALLALGGCYYPPGYYGYYSHPGVVYDNGTVASGQGYADNGYADNGYYYGGQAGYYGGSGYYYPGYAYGPYYGGYYGGYYPWWPVGLSLGFGYGYYGGHGGHGGHSHGGGGGHHGH